MNECDILAGGGVKTYSDPPTYFRGCRPRVQAAIPTATIPTNASEKAQLTLTLTLIRTLTLILTLTLTLTLILTLTHCITHLEMSE